MDDLAETIQHCRALLARLQATPHVPELRAVFLELATLTGRLQGAVSVARREHGDSDEIRQAEASLERFKETTRKVGLDIRLASEPALSLGLQVALQQALDSLEWLEKAGT